jgi:hypothetical protein
MSSAHPPFAHNPHVYNGIDPAGNPTQGLVVHSAIAVGEQGPELRTLPYDAQVVSVEDFQAAQAAAEEAEGDGQPDGNANTDVDGDGQTTGYELFTKDDLVAECKTRGLPVTGNKPDLVARLQEADKAAADKPAEGGE